VSVCVTDCLAYSDNLCQQRCCLYNSSQCLLWLIYQCTNEIDSAYIIRLRWHFARRGCNLWLDGPTQVRYVMYWLYVQPITCLFSTFKRSLWLTTTGHIWSKKKYSRCILVKRHITISEKCGKQCTCFEI